MKQHTAGPWHFNTEIVTHGVRLVYGHDNYLVADAGRIPRRTQQEMDANALLISKAPKMFDALQYIKNHCEELWAQDEKYRAGISYIMDAITEAIGDA